MSSRIDLKSARLKTAQKYSNWLLFYLFFQKQAPFSVPSMLNPHLDEDEKGKAKKLFDLVKLGAYPGNELGPTPRDFRWKKRLETWDLAERLRNKFNAGIADVEEIICLAQKLGYWSVWFTVFKGYDEVRKRLISDFTGTCASCFDANNHYEPIKRNK